MNTVRLRCSPGQKTFRKCERFFDLHHGLWYTKSLDLMIRRLTFNLLLGSLLLLPTVTQAQIQTGTVAEDFGSTYRRQERGTFAFWDTKNREVSLPLQYTVELLPQGTAWPTVAAPLKFAVVVSRFSRVPTGKIKADALIAEAGGFTHALMPGFYGGMWVSLNNGLELTVSRIPEFKDL